MKTCSYCGHVNEDSTTVCAGCGEVLNKNPAEPVNPELVDPNENLVVVATFDDTVEASLAKDRLEQAGIEACIPEELDPSPFGNFRPLARVTVRVAQKDAVAAKEVLAEPPQ
jgi:hypothetical protein